ncbi:MAG TPA: type II CAAX endopeptidase family protein [Flavitalea sp.]|nr:type II CAAX endopeptidase family protein [Flavitalea sp.]
MQDRKKTESINPWLQVIIFLAVYLLAFMALASVLPRAKTTDITDSLFIPIAASSVISITIVIFAMFVFKQDSTPLGWTFIGQTRPAISGACLGIFLITCGSLVLYAGKWLEWTATDAAISDTIILALLLFVSAFSEELVFRGFILGRLLKKSSRLTGLIASSAIFGLFHFNNPEISPIAMINIFLGGILLGITYSYTRNIWFGVMLHFSWNLLQGPIFGMPVSGLVLPSVISSQLAGPELITGGKFGLEASLVQGILLLLSCLGLWVLNAVENKPVATAEKI